jgi:hypothetical protein
MKRCLALESALSKPYKYSNPNQALDEKEEEPSYADALQPQFYPISFHVVHLFWCDNNGKGGGLTAFCLPAG